ncbi:unnamed protein product [Phytomonas sp. Hart1]|nr:unnamed protein product [Phytomonas sp. Hart1]|eukprot:CCW67971.1 unnamed protein product [Phytomonas sp. isolate Hart1]
MCDSCKRTFTLQDIHEQLSKDKNRCLVIINGLVCDLTDFVDEHPGGGDIIIRNNGKDVTSAFQCLHSRKTRFRVNDWAIGTFVDSLSELSSHNGIYKQ